MHGFTKALALEVVRKSSQPMPSPRLHGDKNGHGDPEGRPRHQNNPQIPMGRLGRSEEVAGLVAYQLFGRHLDLVALQ